MARLAWILSRDRTDWTWDFISHTARQEESSSLCLLSGVGLGLWLCTPMFLGWHADIKGQVCSHGQLLVGLP